MMTAVPLLKRVCLAGVLSIGTSAFAAPDCTDFNDNTRLSSHDRQWCQALAFKANYLKSGFVEAPPGSDGAARGVKGRLATRFSNSGAASVSGSMTLDQLDGRFRLKLASTDNSLYYGRKIQVSGNILSGEGRVEVYSYVDVDLWKLAAVLVDDPVRNAPPPEDGLILKGYTVTDIPAGAAHPFTANLIPLAGDFFLLLRAPDGTARNVQITIDKS
ncbi:hypothetical protein MWU54_11675 [Marivita sp. S6314]|uniref:hypothetical protein n=1 Tax=Marivita sp. S6314 TaxID=2926406 RepID=UPI001FF659C7|nr:hypothetical protein [Marivita sp. S6314]MCK0150687.1 hypothetical protein [Marivita sp. S6314]